MYELTQRREMNLVREAIKAAQVHTFEIRTTPQVNFVDPSNTLLCEISGRKWGCRRKKHVLDRARFHNFYRFSPVLSLFLGISHNLTSALSVDPNLIHVGYVVKIGWSADGWD